jgi:hypothetical protein
MLVIMTQANPPLTSRPAGLFIGSVVAILSLLAVGDQWPIKKSGKYG